MAKVNDFELKSHYYVHFQTSILKKGKEPTYYTIYGLKSITTVLLQE